MKIFRIDDICVNTEKEKFFSMLKELDNKYNKCKFILGISPLVNDMDKYDGTKRERIFPSIYNAYSDYRIFYSVNKLGIPKFIEETLKIYGDRIGIASHGLVHVDHRLLTKEAQEMSILMSCSLVQSKVFIPPFNKYDKNTIEICKENDIELIKFEDGWKHIKYEKIVDNYQNYYFHTHDFTKEEFLNILGNLYK